jgi:hypothetical protein
MRTLCHVAALVLTVGALGLAPHARATDDEFAARLTRQIDAVVDLFQPGGSEIPREKLGDALIDVRARGQLFRLESLLRLYVRAHSGLEKYRRNVKELEDGLGAYTFADDSVSFAKSTFKEENQTRKPDAARLAAQEQVLKRLETDRDVARGVFKQLAAKSTLGSDLPKLRALVVSRFANWSTSRELTYVKGELERMLTNVREGRFDFNKLEEGIHEFRRRLRWIPIVIDSLDGLILARDEPPGVCPIPALEKLAGSSAAKHRYSNPSRRFPATRPCSISRCLLWQVVKATNDLGRIKDDALGNTAIAAALDNDIYVASSKDVTPEEIARAKAVRTELFNSRALESLMDQIHSCKS